MRSVRLLALVAVLGGLFVLAMSCKDVSFSPLTEIAVMPGNVTFPLKAPAGQPASSSFAEDQHFYIENRSFSANVRVYELELWNKLTNDLMVPLFNNQPMFSGDKHDYMGYYFDYQHETLKNQHLFKLEFDFDLRYLVTDNQKDKAQNVDRHVIDNLANAVIVKARCSEDSNDICDLYSLTNIKETKSAQPLSLYALNFCDQLVLRTYLKSKLLDGNMTDYALLVPRRFSTYRQLASEGDVYEGSQLVKGEAETMNPWKKELDLASCPESSCRYEKFYEDMMVLQQPDGLYGVNPDTFVTASGDIDWTAVFNACTDPSTGLFDPTKLSVDIVSGGQPDAEKILNKVKIDTIKTIVRYIREPKIVTPEGERDAREVLICDSSDATLQQMCTAEYDEIRPIANVFQARISHSARVDASGSSKDSQVSGFLSMVDINLQGKASGFPVPKIVDDAGQEDPNDSCNLLTHKQPLDKVYIDGCQSFSPGGHDPLAYYWKIVEKPPNAVDAVLIAPTGDFENPEDISNQYTEICNPKIYLPLAGIYKIALKVRDSRGVESDDPANNATCQWAYITLNVIPDNKVYVQLAWDKGSCPNDPKTGVDVDLYLVRQRECGTMGLPFAYQDRIEAPAFSMPTSCTSNSDCCPPGYSCAGLDCVNGTCQTSCTSDDYCKRAHPYYTCDNGQCSANGGTWVCDDDIDAMTPDCGGQGYCVPQRKTSPDEDRICTKHSYEAINDSCGWNNGSPDWGVPFDPTDDPEKDWDDVNGYGPETISIPEPPDGVYRAVARLYSDACRLVSETDPVHVYGTVYVNGEKCDLNLSMPMSKTMVYWKMVDIHWHGESTNCSDVTVLPLNPPNANESVANQCLSGGPDCAYANPFWAVSGSAFDPCDSLLPRSIWCDEAGDPDCCYENGGTCACCSQ